MRTIHRDIVAAIIFSKDGKIFQGMKDPKGGGVYADAWHIPGGGVKQGETKEQALVREIKEETGLDLARTTLELIDDIGEGNSEKTLNDTQEKVLCHMKFYVYKVVLDQNAEDICITLNDDLANYHWVTIPELKSVKSTPPSQELFARLGYI